MIVDVHTHPPQYRGEIPEDKIVYNDVWRPDRKVKAVTNWDDFMEAEKMADKVITFNIAWQPSSNVSGGIEARHNVGDLPGNYNDATAAFVNAYPDKLIGFMALHPHDPNMLDEFERCRVDLGMKGIKLGANYQIFDPLETRALKIYELAQKYDMPILFHQGTSPVRMAPITYSHPLAMDEVAMRYPDLKMILAHMGHPWTADCSVVIRKHPNLYADVSALIYRPYGFYEALMRATEWKVLDKLMLGSDFPVTTAEETINALRNVNSIVEGTNFPRVPEDKIEEIIHRDSLGLLGLD
ncbi:MAG: amidohydrolase [Anaerolineaceae bacterium]|nr:amidohydrolase [Anaerolineaceae bacterium]